MKRAFRVIILIAVLFGTLGLAHASSQVAWAADSPETGDGSMLSQTDPSTVLQGDDDDDDCDDPRNKHRPRCNKDKIKDRIKKFCRNHPRLCGSVLPPPHHVIIPVTGDYSVGGFCTLSTVWNDTDITLDASLIAPLPRELPDKVQKVRQGCLLDYYHAAEHMDNLPAASGNTTICFAAAPGKQSTVYFYNRYAPHPEWVALETIAGVGNACAPANESGVYVATFAKR